MSNAQALIFVALVAIMVALALWAVSVARQCLLLWPWK
jgi:hypothetical protein